MTLNWSADLTQANSNAAGYQNLNYNQQTPAGDGTSAGLIYPLPISTAPDGIRSIQVFLPTGGKRNEIQPNGASFNAGDNFYFSQQFYLPSGFDVTASAGSQYQVIEQMREQDDNGSPVVAFEVRNGSILLTGAYGILGASPANQYQYSQTLLATVATGHRYSLIYRMGPFSTSPGGTTIDVWIDGTQVLTNFTIPPPTLIGGTTYRKQGLYRDPANTTVQTLWQSGQGQGTTYADVAALVSAAPGAGANLRAISTLNPTVFVPSSGTAVPAITLDSAAHYNTVFQNINKTFWAGSNNIFPVQLLDGRKIWISGLSWPGPLNSSYHRSGTQSIFNTFLVESDSSIVPFGPTSSVSGHSYLLDSTQVFPSLAVAPSRLDPVAGIALRDALYLTVTSSTTDYQSKFIYGTKYLIDIPTKTLASGAAPIRRYTAMPNYTDIYYGSGFYSFGDGYIYIAGHRTTGSGVWNTYLARVPQASFSNITSIPANMTYFQGTGWTQAISTAVPIITSAGQNVGIGFTPDGNYNYMFRGTGSQANTIFNLAQRSVSIPSPNIRAASVNSSYTIVPDSGAVGFTAPEVYDVPWATLASGNRLGMYTTVQTSSSYDLAHPNFSRPHFFEYNYSQPATVTGIPSAPPVLSVVSTPVVSAPVVVPVIIPPTVLPTPTYVTGATLAYTTLATGPDYIQVSNFSVVAGELLVVKAATCLGDMPITNCHGSGLSWTPQVTTPGTAPDPVSRIAIYTAIAPATGTITITVNITSPVNNGVACFRVDRWRGAAIATSPATNVVCPALNPSSTIVTQNTNSVVSWIDGDWNSAPGAPSYIGGAIQDGSYIYAVALSAYFAHQSAATPGTQAYGMTAPTGQIPTMGAIEIIASA